MSELRGLVKQALGHIDRAMVTVAALLRLADVEYGPKSSEFKTIDLSAICADLFEFYEPLATSKSIGMTLEIQSPVEILGDGDLMREAVSNLIGNAIKFTPEDGAVKVSVARKTAGRSFGCATTESGSSPRSGTRYSSDFTGPRAVIAFPAAVWA